MQITTKRAGSTLHVALSGELDHHSAAQIRQELDIALTEDVRELVLDLSAVSFMDSSGIGVILGRYRAMQERGGNLRINGMSTYAARILKMAGILPLVGRQGSKRDGKRGMKDV
ncbi:MAG: STAS domain-containing protein [Candidatus Pelethousia sp.]|nr:STAS domain-containing protein [Candidatus Pelethousia sp.]